MNDIVILGSARITAETRWFEVTGLNVIESNQAFAAQELAIERLS